MRCTTAVCLTLGASAVLGCAPSGTSCDGPCGTVVVDDGYMTIASNDTPVEEPDWDEMERTALTVI